uniref:Uncharacterized protein LOC110220945 isoform X2 n=1 Tax=Phascolarctos cinereus TaxID=38626 RepID=A0A6P5LR21_PHACI|nr:uncharacterized protein LOC110220945 isoform X2 [Phascolarctos cinereus]
MTSSSKQVGSATVTVVVEVASLPEAGHDTCSPRFLLDGSQMLLLDPGDPEEHRFTFDRVLGPEHAQEAKQEFLENIRAVLGSVSRGYSVSVLIRGREAQQLDQVPQLLAMLFEEIQPPGASEPSLRTLSLVQLNSSGRGRDLLLPGTSDLSLLDVYPLGLVVEGVSEAEVLDSKSSCQLYLKAMEGLDSTSSLLTVTISCLGPSTIKRPWARGMWRGSLRVLQLPEARDCPLLLALAGKASKAQMGSLPWIVTRLLFGNSYSSLLLHLDPQATPLNLLLASLSGATGARDPAQLKQVSPTLWDASEEIQARRAAVQDLRSGLSGTVLQESQLTQLSLVLRELKVLKNQSRYWETRLLKGAGASAPRLLNLQVPELEEAFFPVFQKHPQARTSETLGLGRKPHLPAAPRNYPLGASKKQASDVALQFMLARAHRQLLQEHHQSQIQEQLSCLGKNKETAADQAPDLSAECPSWWQDHTALVLQLEALRVERDAAERDLEALYELHVQGARAQTCHMLQHRCSGLAGGCGRSRLLPGSSITESCWLESYRMLSHWPRRTNNSNSRTRSFGRKARRGEKKFELWQSALTPFS